MTVQVVRFAGPTQAWPDRARWDTRPTLPVPTFSAVCGFLHACFGQPRPERGQPWVLHPALRDAHIAVRVDHPGQVLKDYQTINPLPLRMFAGDPKYTDPKQNHPDPSDMAYVRQGDGGVWMGGKNAYTSTRQYLADAAFTVLIHTRGEINSADLVAALTRPRFAPYLGRKNSPPTWPWYLGDFSGTVDEAARTVPALTRDTFASVNRNRNRAVTGTPTTELDVHHLQGGPTSGTSITNTPTLPMDRPGGQYRNHTVVVTSITAPAADDTAVILAWAASNLQHPARTVDA